MPKPTVATTERTTHPPLILIHLGASCNSQQKVGGWAAVLRKVDENGSVVEGKTKTLGARVSETTIIRMEFTAATEALKMLKRAVLPVVIVTHSQTVKLAVEQWMPGWLTSGERSGGRKIANLDLVTELAALVKTQRIEWRWEPKGSLDPRFQEANKLAKKQWKAAS